MKAILRCSAVALLVVVACNAPNTDLFSPVPEGMADGDAGVSGSSSELPTSAGTHAGAASSAAGKGSIAVAGASAGNTAGAGGTKGEAGAASSNDAGKAGSAGTSGPDSSGSAGAPEGSAGSPDQPPEPPTPMCGNGIIEAGEQCDDSGKAGADGCDAQCQVVCSQFGAGALESEDHHCYVGYDQADFEGSVAACVKRNAHLVTISSEAENKLVLKLVNDSKYIGAREDVVDTAVGKGAYGWITEEPLSFTRWAEKEPDQAEYHCGSTFNGHCYEHCVAITGKGTWEDRRCDAPDGYVCEWEPVGKK